MSDDRKKRIEELKRKNEDAKKKLENAKTALSVNSLNTQNNSTPPQIQNNTPSNVSTNNAPKPGSSSSVDQLIKAVTNKPAGELNIEEIKKITNKRLSRYNVDNLGFYKIEQSILGITPETYEMEVQCDIKLSDEGSEEEGEEKKFTDQGYRRSFIGAKTKKNPFGQSTNKKNEIKDQQQEEKLVSKFVEEELVVSKNKTIINEELRRQLMNSSELGEFLNTKTRYVERVVKF